LVGLGFIGQIHLRSWRALGVEPVALRPPEPVDPARLDGLFLHDDVPSLLRDVEIVDVCSPPAFHAEMVAAAAAAGRHAICEKPLALTPAEVARMRDACAAAGTQLLPAHAVRYFAEYRAIQRAVAAGAIGRVGVVRLARESYMPSGGVGGWLFDKALSGGIVFDLMIHDIDFALWLAGPVREVFAQGIAVRGRGLEDHVYAVLTHASGALTHVTASWAQVAPVFATRVEVAGSEGLLTYDSEAAEAEVWRRHHAAAAPVAITGLPGSIGDSAADDDPFVAELRDFALAIRTGSRPRVAAREAEEAVRVAAAAAESLGSGLPARVEGGDR
jgi:predicted dehydrogenase